MRNIDLKCTACGHIVIDHLQRRSDEPLPTCPGRSFYEADAERVLTWGVSCGAPMERVYLPTQRGNVIGDDIPGGIEIKNALCNADGTPRRYYSKSEIAREAAARGYTNLVEHKGSRGSDKSRHTSRWI